MIVIVRVLHTATVDEKLARMLHLFFINLHILDF